MQDSPTTAFRSAFRRKSRERGERYAQLGRVVELERVQVGVRAQVIGSRIYEVTVGLDPDDPLGQCTCEAFWKFGPCKHMWAALVAAESTLGSSGRADPAERPSAAPQPARRESQRAQRWRARLQDMLRHSQPLLEDPWEQVEAQKTRIEYVLDHSYSLQQQDPVVHATQRKRLKSGGWGDARPYIAGRATHPDPSDPLDVRIFGLLGYELPDGPGRGLGSWNHWGYEGEPSFRLGRQLVSEVLPLMAATGRLFLARPSSEPQGLKWDAGEPWELQLALDSAPAAKSTKRTGDLVLSGVFERGEERIELEDVELLYEAGFLIAGGAVSRYDAERADGWVQELHANGPLRVPAKDEEALRRLLTRLPIRAWGDAGWMQDVALGAPQPHLFVLPGHSNAAGARVECRVSFDYGVGIPIGPEHDVRVLESSDGKRRVRRDFGAEQRFLERYLAAGARRTHWDKRPDAHGTIAVSRVPKIVRELLSEGWSVEAEGHRLRRPGSTSVSIRSGVDWFELEGSVSFDGHDVPFPELLKAARDGRKEVVLGDGSTGMLPEDWLEKWGLLDLGDTSAGDRVRFRHNQAWLLDSLLAEHAGVERDAAFERQRARLSRFRKVRARREPRGFRGELRPYQRDGLGWFRFLSELGLGGCLADDMGLGKTVQVLALLESRRLQARKSGRASIVVAPRSLVFNWLDEAARFTPNLRTFEYHGTGRRERLEAAGRVDLIVTTYGTLRRDAVEFASDSFDYVVLDEATAIKNAGSQAAKAARLLRAEHRLALSGTPIENHLGELWSLFEFLNPGMLGSSRVFQQLSGGTDPGELARALRPFFLRRTKSEVLKDLPEKSEQIVLCELAAAERRRYEELRDHYRAALLGGPAGSDGADATGGTDLPRNKIQVLEALLRLRQSACHPALMDREHHAEPSAKLEALMPRLEELVAEGHKVLVFSQFTRFLSIVRSRLDDLGIVYEYLDGRTRKRKEKVDRFQNDPDCPLFLISLKAGGHGLNLTASDYVFLLDPWWNPAVEAQAIDRAHRMGQVRPVFAYRLIAKDTVEERVLELQQRKRELAETLLGGGSRVLKDLTREDLDRLLS